PPPPARTPLAGPRARPAAGGMNRSRQSSRDGSRWEHDFGLTHTDVAEPACCHLARRPPRSRYGRVRASWPHVRELSQCARGGHRVERAAIWGYVRAMASAPGRYALGATASGGIDAEVVAAKARDLGVMGWVRPTGEIHAEGEANAVHEL